MRRQLPYDCCGIGMRDERNGRSFGELRPALDDEFETFSETGQAASDQPRMVSVKRTKSEATLTTLSTRPVPSKARRDSLLQQRATITREIASQASPEGRPGYVWIKDMKCCGGCPAGTHQGRTGVTPATKTKLRSLRVSQLFIFWRALRRTK